MKKVSFKVCILLCRVFIEMIMPIINHSAEKIIVITFYILKIENI